MKNNWIKKGCIYKVDGSKLWNKTHSQVPVVDIISSNRLRIYYATRDEDGRSGTSFIEVNSENPQQIEYVHDSLILELGKPGTFDDSGIMPTCIINKDGFKYLYYIGWTTRHTVPFSNSIGLAISKDGGKTFSKMFKGPVIGQGPLEPYFTGTCEVIQLNGEYVAYYLSCNGWKKINSKYEPFYNLKIATSKNAIDWTITGKIAINLEDNEGGIASASVLNLGDYYGMWFSVRSSSDYRNNLENSYRIGYAESTDGFKWKRKESNIIPISEDGWDSKMIAYPNVITTESKFYLFYNGNGFGKTGFGYAEKAIT
ncbi:MAG: hypothetical protein DWP94_10630 [Flavobacterium sp.]|nr:MAG: hypothetical protein DWP94_10630 [Flavobacterium sp.]